MNENAFIALLLVGTAFVFGAAILGLQFVGWMP